MRLSSPLVAALMVFAPLGASARAGDPSEPCASVGDPAGGWLAHAVTLDPSPRLEVRPGRNYGCPELVEALRAAVDRVHERFGGAHPLVIGDISRKKGGRLPPHKSHQSGRDADVGFYFRGRTSSPGWFVKATRDNLDVPRTWAFLEALLEADALEYVFLDRWIQRRLYDYAKAEGRRSPAELSRIFQYPRPRGQRVGIIRHLRGHRDHMHLRFRAERCVEAGRQLLRAHPELARPRPVYYRVRRGDSLSRIARRHRVSVAQLRRWNHLRRGAVLRPRDRLIVGWRRPDLPG